MKELIISMKWALTIVCKNLEALTEGVLLKKEKLTGKQMCHSLFFYSSNRFYVTFPDDNSGILIKFSI